MANQSQYEIFSAWEEAQFLIECAFYLGEDGDLEAVFEGIKKAKQTFKFSTLIEIMLTEACLRHYEACAKERRKQTRKTFVYFIQSNETQKIKIGKTTSAVKSRISQIHGMHGAKLNLLATIEDAQGNLEKKLHEHFIANKTHNEWFTPDAYMMDFIKKLPSSISELEIEKLGI